ncbi:MAG: glutamine-hydrolyzing carbamoyl-phosphate synthase small subunit [Oligosphaeraceae bacterium]|nr:glutamine-hydrolyzing carbamoyl-phosphate synthase small subunit [Oligosphaeraceae bacterium]
MTNRHFLALADGEIFFAQSCGAPVDTLGEAVFNTGMTGYQEIVSDPSYAGQIVALSTAEVGNYGCNPDDMESRGLFLRGLLVQNLNPPSNFQSQETLAELLRRCGVPALSNLDTRRLVLHLRENGTSKAFLHASAEDITPAEGVARARAWEGLDQQDYATLVSDPEGKIWNREGDYKVIAVDYGIKYNILRMLAAAGLQVEVVPAWTSAGEILSRRPDGVFLSNGPADPRAVKGALELARGLLGKVPLMGICLGHQILGLAAGAECSRLKFGHHGCNHPVKNLLLNRIEITSQNHNYALGENSLPACLELTHRNLNDQTVEGIRHRREPMFAVQYHPEAGPGPHDSQYLFTQFTELMHR